MFILLIPILLLYTLRLIKDIVNKIHSVDILTA